MAILTFAELQAEVAAFHAAEAARSAPAAVACRAIETLRAALLDCTAVERGEVLELLRDEVLGSPVTA